MWLKIDDGFSDHRKVDGLSDGAFRLHVVGMNYAARNDTNGLIPTSRPPRLIPTFKRQYITELEKAALWEPDPEGWRIHDFLVYNPSAEELKAKREKEREKKRTQRAAGAKAVDHDGDGRFVSRGMSPGDTHGDSLGDVPGESRGESPATRPVPKREPQNTPSNGAVVNGSSAQPRVTVSKPDEDPDFAEFWASYPRRVAKQEAAIAYRKAKGSTKGAPAEILAGLRRWVIAWRADGRSIDKYPHAATWLNGRRWLDELDDVAPTNGIGHLRLEGTAS